MKYFVSYNWWSKNQSGSGAMQINLDFRISDYSDIKLIKEHIDKEVKDEYGSPINSCVMNYILLSEREEVSEAEEKESVRFGAKKSTINFEEKFEIFKRNSKGEWFVDLEGALDREDLAFLENEAGQYIHVEKEILPLIKRVELDWLNLQKLINKLKAENKRLRKIENLEPIDKEEE